MCALVVAMSAAVTLVGCEANGASEPEDIEMVGDFTSEHELCSVDDFLVTRRERPRKYLQWAASGSEIFFGHWQTVYSVASDGSHMQQVVDASRGVEFQSKKYLPGHVESADVSADGRRIAVTVCHKGTDTRGRRGYDGRSWGDVVYLTEVLDRADGSSKDVGLGRGVSWSPDGAWLGFYRWHEIGNDWRSREEARVHVMRADGSDHREVDVGIGPPQWSPDGRWLAFVRSPSIILAETNGTKQRQLPATPRIVSDPAWSPDGTRLAFARAEDQTVGLYTIGVDGGNMQRVTSVEDWWQQRRATPKPKDLRGWIGGAWIPSVAWSPDGTRLLYTCGLATCVVGVDGTPLGKSPADPAGIPLAAWSPDGTRIAVLGDASLGGVPLSAPYHFIALYTMAPDGSDIRILIGVASQGKPVLAGRASSAVN